VGYDSNHLHICCAKLFTVATFTFVICCN